MAYPIKGGDYEVEDLDKVSGTMQNAGIEWNEYRLT